MTWRWWGSRTCGQTWAGCGARGHAAGRRRAVGGHERRGAGGGPGLRGGRGAARAHAHGDLAGGGVPRADHGRAGGGPVVTRLLTGELIKVRTTRTAIGFG